MYTIPLKCRRLHNDAKLPVKNGGCASLDVHAYLRSESGHPTKFVLPAGLTRSVPTGLSLTPDDDHIVMLLSHTNLASRGVNVMNPLPSPHTLTVLLHNSSPMTEWIEHADPIAQVILVQLPTPIVMEESA